MAFHTFLGYYCLREYKGYKESFRPKLNKNKMEMESNIGSSLRMVHGSMSSLDSDEVLGADEYEYPKAEKLNKLANITFVIIYLAFNIFYWSVAMGVYFA